MTIRTSILSGILLLCTSAVAQESFDHYSTGFELEGAHQNVSCDRCHSGGIFEGTNPNCVGCHSQIGTVLSSMKPAGHVTSAETCDSCHTTSAWSPIYYMDHMAVSGSCGTCHNGNTATGKPPGHIVSGDNCDDCHNSSLWVPAVFDHANITGGCFSCHNGLDATGKGNGHINTANICEDCHNSSSWDPVFVVDHTQVVGTCFSCHDGTTATGKHPTHLVSGDNCDDCHTTSGPTTASAAITAPMRRASIRPISIRPISARTATTT
jgi:hypothetical protein